MEFDQRDLEELRNVESQGYPPIKNSTLYKMYKNGDRSKKLHSIISFNLEIGEFNEWKFLPDNDFAFFNNEFIKLYVVPALRGYFHFLLSVKDKNLKTQGLKDLSECFYFLIRDKDKTFVLKEYVEGSKIVLDKFDKYRRYLDFYYHNQGEDDTIANQFTNFISSLVEGIDSNEEFWIARDIAISWSKNELKERNFKETGIKETDFERDQRESEESIQKEEELEEEMIQKYGPAQSLVEDYYKYEA